MKSLHKLVIMASTASLVFLGLAGTRAHADNIAPLRTKSQIAKHVSKQVNDLDAIRRQVQEREENDGGCG